MWRYLGVAGTIKGLCSGPGLPVAWWGGGGGVIAHFSSSLPHWLSCLVPGKRSALSEFKYIKKIQNTEAALSSRAQLVKCLSPYVGLFLNLPPAIQRLHGLPRVRPMLPITNTSDGQIQIGRQRREQSIWIRMGPPSISFFTKEASLASS